MKENGIMDEELMEEGEIKKEEIWDEKQDIVDGIESGDGGADVGIQQEKNNQGYGNLCMFSCVLLCVCVCVCSVRFWFLFFCFGFLWCIVNQLWDSAKEKVRLEKKKTQGIRNWGPFFLYLNGFFKFLKINEIVSMKFLQKLKTFQKRN